MEFIKSIFSSPTRFLSQYKLYHSHIWPVIKYIASLDYCDLGKFSIHWNRTVSRLIDLGLPRKWMPTFAPPSTSTDGIISSGQSSCLSELSFKSAQGFEELIRRPNMDNLEIGTGFIATGMSNQESMQHEETQTDMQKMIEEIRRRDTEHRRAMAMLQAQMNQMMSTMQKQSQNNNQVPLQPVRPNPGRSSEQREPLGKEKPLKWPEAYDHKDRSKWTTTHGILRYICWRNVEERNILEPSDFFMQLYSHAVTGTAKDMITGQF